MSRYFTIQQLSPFVVGVWMLAGWTPAVSSQDRGATDRTAPVRYTALAVRTVGITATQPIEINIQRWTTNAEHDALNVEMMEGGQGPLLRAMRAMPDIGRVSSPGAVGFPLKYARRVPRADGAEQVTLITERQMSFWEVTQMPRSTDYPFTLIEFNLDARGEGQGRVLVATLLSYNRASRMLTIENFEHAPVLLQGVRRVN
jgi:hypothetical protein